jgi:hypothetical protein
VHPNADGQTALLTTAAAVAHWFQWAAAPILTLIALLSGVRSVVLLYCDWPHLAARLRARWRGRPDPTPPGPATPPGAE